EAAAVGPVGLPQVGEACLRQRVVVLRESPALTVAVPLAARNQGQPAVVQQKAASEAVLPVVAHRRPAESLRAVAPQEVVERQEQTVAAARQAGSRPQADA